MQKITRLPYKIGITGTIGAGKSWVGECLWELGVPVLDTDAVVGELYREDSRLKQTLAEHFGQVILDMDGGIDKKALAQAVFKDPEALQFLESVIHPLVGEKVQAFLEDRSQESPFRAVLVPLLFEAVTEDRYDEIWAVTVTPEIKLMERLMARGGISEEEIQKRMARQLTQSEKARRADRLIDNSGTPKETCRQVAEALKVLRERM